jgi:hypothetical protein
MKDIKSLSDQIRQTAYDIHVYHEHSHTSYLKSARLEHGLLINFGSYKFEIRKFTWSQDQPRRTQSIRNFLLSALSALFAVN